MHAATVALDAAPAGSLVEPAGVLADASFLADLRTQLLRFANLQLNDAGAAEDAVQEAMTGALRNAGSFDGRAAYKTWVFAILRHKIADSLRSRYRAAASEDGDPAGFDEDNGYASDCFNDTGHWEKAHRPADWGDPQEALRQAQFWRVFELCLDALPGAQARVFMMREIIELDTSEVCAAVGITVTNLNVMLYRARLRLRECLEGRWFGKEARA